jgi:hypothetical protein
MFIHTDSNHSCRIGMSEGTIQSVNFGRFQGQEAIEALKGIKWGRFTFSAVAFRSASRRPLPSTEAILADLAERTWYGANQPAGFPTGLGGPSPSPFQAPQSAEANDLGATGDLEGDIFAAAQRSLGEAPRPSPFETRSPPTPAAKGADSVKGMAKRFLGGGRPAPEPSRTDEGSDALARTLFGATDLDLEESRREGVGGVLPLEPFAPPAAPAPAPVGRVQDEDAMVRDLLASAAQEGPPSTLDMSDEAIAHDLFATAGGGSRASAPDEDADAFAMELFAAAMPERQGPKVDEAELAIAQDLFAGAGQGDLGAVAEEGDEAIAQGLFAAAGAPAAATEPPESETLLPPSETGEHSVLEISREIFHAALEGEGPPQGSAPHESAAVDRDLTRELFSGIAYNPFDRNMPAPDTQELGPLTSMQRVFGSDLVELVTERLARIIGPAAPLAMDEVEEALHGLTEPTQLELVLTILAEQIDDPAQARTFHRELMETVFG